MRYRDRPELQDRLAAEYVLGTLRGRARLRFESWARADAALRRRIEDWQARLTPMTDAVAPVRPSPRVWKAIEARIGASPAALGGAARPTGAGTRGPGFWESLAFWRATGLVASGMAAALLVTVALQKPQIIEVPVDRVVEVPSKQMQPAYVAALRDNSGKVVFIAYANRESNELWFKRIDMANPKDDMGYELWGLPTEPGGKARSLGMIPGVEKGTIRLAAAADKTLADFPELAITMEPAKGSDGTATGPVIAKGDCQKFW